MSTPSGSQSTSTPVMTAAEFEAWTLAPKLRFSAKHTNSTSTRPPSLYDQHIPEELQPKIIYLGKPHYQPNSSDISDPIPAIHHYFAELCKRPAVLCLLTGAARDKIQSRWTHNLEYIGKLNSQNEDGVVQAERRVADIVYDLSSLLLFDLSKDQLENIGAWTALATLSSTERETQADLLLGLEEKDAILECDSRNSSQSRCGGIWPLLQHLNMDFMQYLTSMECKNLKLGDPMGYLALLLLSCLTQQVQVDLWPKAHCHDCGEFRKSHEVQFGRATVQLPLDSTKKYGLTTLPLSSEVGLVNTEIGRVLGLVLADRHPDGLDPDATKKRRNPTNTSEFYDRVRNPMLNLLRSLESQPTMEVLDQFDDKSELLNDIMRWVNTMRDIFIQACAQLIRHNLTFCTVTSYNNSYLFHRNRKTGDITMSPLQSSSKAGHIIQRAVWLSESFHDSKDRSEIDDQWDDPYRGVKSNLLPDPAVSSSQEGDDPELDPDYQPNQSDLDDDDDDEAIEDEVNAHGQKVRRSKRKRSKKVTNTGSNANPPRPPRGGAGGAGGSGRAGNTQTRGNTGKRNASTTNKNSADSSSSGSRAKRPRQKVAGLEILLQQIHLAFNCTKPLLQSSAFSCFYRVPFMTTASTPGTRPVYFPIPFSMTTPPRRTMAAIASQSGGESHSLPVYEGTPPGRRSSVASIASDPSTVSSASGTSLWSSGGSIASSSHTAPPSSSPSSPSGGHRGKSSAANNLMRGIHMPEPVREGSGPGSTTGVAAAPAPTDPAQNSPPKAIVVDRGGTILDIQLAESEEMKWIIWGGNLILEGLDFAVEHIRIVIKLADWERDPEKEGNISKAGTALLAESKIYEYLAKVAPDFDITPHYYGVFNDSGSIALVLEDGGERLRRNSLKTLDDSEKHELFEKAQQLHRLGILHGDLTERNILMDEDNNFRLIDFHVSQLDHECSWNGSNGCGELKQFADDLGMKL